jgi:DNA-binding NarL/FixJ family response regulator
MPQDFGRLGFSESMTPPPHPSKRHLRVLLVDDQPLFLEMLALTLLPDAGLEVVGQAHDGLEATALARALEPDVILMDIDMPVMDGIEATRRLSVASPRSRVVVVTASTSPEDGARARAAGACAYIRKWSSSDELREAVVEAAADADPFRGSWTVSLRLLRSA